MKILVFDPGESTGWVFQNGDWLTGGTAPKDHRAVVDLIDTFQPDIIVMERFNLYPGKAASLSWNSFYPCEVIGVIRYCTLQYNIRLVEQAPSVKKYFGGFEQDWDDLKSRIKTTEHTKDAYMHLKYYLLNNKEPS